MPRLSRSLALGGVLYLLVQRQRVADLATLVRLQRTELNFMRSELRALAELSGVPQPSHLHSV